jgi:hypothetical protein
MAKAKTKTITTYIAPPTDAGLVYVSCEFPQTGTKQVTTGDVTLHFDPKTFQTYSIRKNVKVKNVKVDLTERIRREFPAGECIFTSHRIGMAVSVALRMVIAGAKNVVITTATGDFSRVVNGNDVKKLKNVTQAVQKQTRLAAAA